MAAWGIFELPTRRRRHDVSVTVCFAIPHRVSGSPAVAAGLAERFEVSARACIRLVIVIAGTRRRRRSWPGWSTRFWRMIDAGPALTSSTPNGNTHCDRKPVASAGTEAMFTHDLFYYHPETVWVRDPAGWRSSAASSPDGTTPTPKIAMYARRGYRGNSPRNCAISIQRLESPRFANLERAVTTAEAEQEIRAMSRNLFAGRSPTGAVRPRPGRPVPRSREHGRIAGVCAGLGCVFRHPPWAVSGIALHPAVGVRVSSVPCARSPMSCWQYCCTDPAGASLQGFR